MKEADQKTLDEQVELVCSDDDGIAVAQPERVETKPCLRRFIEMNGPIPWPQLTTLFEQVSAKYYEATRATGRTLNLNENNIFVQADGNGGFEVSIDSSTAASRNTRSDTEPVDQFGKLIFYAATGQGLTPGRLRGLKLRQSVRDVVAKATYHEPIKRHQSIVELIDDLRSGKKHPRPRKKSRFAVYGALAFTLSCCALIAGWLNPDVPISPNELHLNQAGVIRLAYHEPVEFDGLAKKDIEALRIAEVEKYKDLLRASYTPFAKIFCGIADGLPWWGIPGYNDQRGDKAAGPSLESQWVMNPFLLAAPEFCAGQWKGSTDAGDANFPWTPKPQDITIRPSEKRMDVTYDITNFRKNAAAHGGFDQAKSFYLMDYNALDMGLRYKYVTADYNLGVKMRTAESTYQYLHQGQTLGRPCNNAGIAPGCSIDWEQLTVMAPGTVTVKLWHCQPNSVDQPADMTCYIHFK